MTPLEALLNALITGAIGGMWYLVGLRVGRRQHPRPPDPRICACGHAYTMRSPDGECAAVVEVMVHDHFDGYHREIFRTTYDDCACVDHTSPEAKALAQAEAEYARLEARLRAEGS